MTLQTVFPHCLLTQKWWLKPFINFLVPANRPFDNVSMDMGFPQEEEFALSNLQLYSVYNFFIFPKEFDRFVDQDYFTASLPATAIERWKKEYHQLVIKSLLNSGGERYISKNPQNIPRIEILHEMYPDAGFIFIYRNPYIVVESLYNFILAIFPGIQLQDVPADFSRKNIARFYSIAMSEYFAMKQRPGAPQCYEIKMEDFINDKIGGIKEIYKTFGLVGFEESVPAFKAYLEKYPSAPHETNNIPEETIHYVNMYASGIVTKLGYDLKSNPMA
jgi:hypothetical protein